MTLSDLEIILMRFYDRAFEDGILAHIFFGRDKQALLQSQIAFTAALLGIPGAPGYVGKPLTVAHKPLGLRLVHFHRRHMLMAEIMEDYGLPTPDQETWLGKERRLLPQILGAAPHQDGYCGP